MVCGALEKVLGGFYGRNLFAGDGRGQLQHAQVVQGSLG
jgi:hypothetical protein